MTTCWYLPSPFPSRRFFLGEMRRNIEYFCTRYETFLIIGDFNLIESNDSLHDFMRDFNLESIVKEPTCFKSVNPTCIDLILTSDSGKFSNIRTIQTGLSDFHAMVGTVLRGSFRKRVLGLSPTGTTVDLIISLLERRLQKN